MGRIYIGKNDVSKICKKIYVGVNGNSKRVTKIYAGVNGKSKLVYTVVVGKANFEITYYTRTTIDSWDSNVSAECVLTALVKLKNPEEVGDKSYNISFEGQVNKIGNLQDYGFPINIGARMDYSFTINKQSSEISTTAFSRSSFDMSHTSINPMSPININLIIKIDNVIYLNYHSTDIEGQKSYTKTVELPL